MRNPRPTIASGWREYVPSPLAVRDARRSVVALAESYGIPSDQLDDIAIAVGEALANAYEHGDGPDGAFAVAVSVECGELIVEVKDRGCGFDCGQEPAEPPPLASARGYGRFLMCKLMDRVEYLAGGTHIRLIKRLSRAG